PALLENPSVSESTLTVMATNGSREVVEAMRRSPRVQNSPPILHAITANPNATVAETAELHQQLVSSGFEDSLPEAESAQAAPHGYNDAEVDAGITAYISEHAKEIAADDGKPFQPLGGIQEPETTSPPATVVAEVTAPEVPGSAPAQGGTGTTAAAAAPAKPAARKPPPGSEQERGSALQKISRLDIKGRIQLAMKGTKEERSILVRDST